MRPTLIHGTIAVPSEDKQLDLHRRKSVTSQASCNAPKTTAKSAGTDGSPHRKAFCRWFSEKPFPAQVGSQPRYG